MLLVFVVCAIASAQDRRGPFTHAKRSIRSRDLDQEHIRLDLKFDWENQQAQGRATLTLVPFKPMKSLTLDAAEMTISNVARLSDDSSSQSSKLKFNTKPHKLIVELGREFKPGEKIRLVVDYVVSKPKHGLHFVVPDESEKNQPNMVWTQSEPEYAHFWYPCIDSPADRLTSEIVATVPAEYTTLSNGDLKSKTLNDDGTQTWHWSQQKSHVPYLFSIVAGEFEAFEQKWNDVPIISYVPKGQRELAARSFEKTPRMMDFFARKIGMKYPWSKYTQICVDEYQWGGMEHTSATTLNMGTLHDGRAHLDTSSDPLVAHELIHQWYGDLLTCKDWGEIWLNESFATFFELLWTEEDLGWDEATWARHANLDWYWREDKKYRRPIVSYQYNEPGRVFDSHAYPKGGRVLHMLRFVLGEEMFWKAIRHYTARNAHRTVETADFRIAIEEATGQGLNWFFDEWVYHGGHPEFRVEWRWDEATKNVRVTVKQVQKVNSVTPLYRMPVELEIATPSATLIRRIEVSKAEETFHFQIEQVPTRVCFDPRDWLLKTLDAPKSKDELLDQLARDPHIMCRFRAAKALAEHGGEKDVLKALAQAVGEDRFWGVRQEAAKSLGKFKGDAARDALRTAAAGDDKSFVRREALKSLGKFKDDATRETLRTAIATDRSYYAIAEALKSLEKVDRANCLDEHVAAAGVISHRQVVLKAAIDGLAKLKDPQGGERLSALLEEDVTPARRAVLIGGLARLKPDDGEILQQLRAQLENDRRNVKRSAIDALVAIGDPGAIDVLLEARQRQETSGMVRSIDEAIEKLREKNKGIEQLQKQLEQLRQQNRKLEERLKKLEAK
jgi:aminopeptidase N